MTERFERGVEVTVEVAVIYYCNKGHYLEPVHMALGEDETPPDFYTCPDHGTNAVFQDSKPAR